MDEFSFLKSPPVNSVLPTDHLIEYHQAPAKSAESKWKPHNPAVWTGDGETTHYQGNQPCAPPTLKQGGGGGLNFQLKKWPCVLRGFPQETITPPVKKTGAPALSFYFSRGQKKEPKRAGGGEKALPPQFSTPF
jgi:hypothetical protein